MLWPDQASFLPVEVNTERIGRTGGGRMPDVHPLVVRLAADLESSPDVALLWGFPGPCPGRDDATRVYLTIDLTEWIDLADADIRHTEHPPTDRSLEPSLLWVNKQAALDYSGGSTGLTADDFLKGDVVETQLQYSSGATAAVAQVNSGRHCPTCSRTTPRTTPGTGVYTTTTRTTPVASPWGFWG
jgi:hypothetical protein